MDIHLSFPLDADSPPFLKNAFIAREWDKMIIGVTKDSGIYAAAEIEPSDLFKVLRALFPEQFA